ncbi:unnamed protein product [Vitrella brassicaformis CCMP3155]|uniref:Uncharacterized protein n=1 Tax=Vitrella brassicaformis (strain CCMP3155) TaxID=1169540 RepID=A0A0G4ENA6_VITBC|nr:unnamed protein product [Vitrella brassicaformis CCMP3155]|eukprot:CEL98509.1 unnamed protein product [Vitrella brassicaformis CCMP3155]
MTVDGTDHLTHTSPPHTPLHASVTHPSSATMPHPSKPAYESLEAKVECIGQFNMWDHRECHLANADEWKQAVRDYLPTAPAIPKMMHQIWVGPKEPPCLWLDTWRVDYLYRNKHWDHTLWTDEDVAKLHMFNRDFYEQERMWQCKADLLRLELLYQHGGIYIDADMVSCGSKCLDPIIEMAEKDSKFLITYEPDTKDKPYSVLGNSVIVAAPKHPLVLMMIYYLRNIYPLKRPHLSVEWVTGPLAYTRALLQTGMPMCVPPSHLFYPAFHFVPNPDAIDLTKFPNSYMFQFGYTCSGLENYVRTQNRCRKALTCKVHSKRKDWPLGSLRPLPSAAEAAAQAATASSSAPKVIHQFVFQTSDMKPERWMATWYQDFCRRHPEYRYKCWTLKDLKGRSFFGANLYHVDRKMDALAVKMLALEILYDEGGYVVPLGTLFKGPEAPSLFTSPLPAGGFLEHHSILAAAPRSPRCLEAIRTLYDGGLDPKQAGKQIGESEGVLCQGLPDSGAVYTSFEEWSRFLGAEAIFDLVGSEKTDETAARWAYNSQVPIFRVPARGPDRVSDAPLPPQLTNFDGRCAVITDSDMYVSRSLWDALPGLVGAADQEHPGWEALIVGVEWEAGMECTEVYRIKMPIKPETCEYLGVVLNHGVARRIGSVLHGAAGDVELTQMVLDKCHEWKVLFAGEKCQYTKELTAVFRGMPAIERAFQKLANHTPPFESTHVELHGNLLKAHHYNQLAYELSSDPQQRLFFRAWNLDGGMNCEMRLTRGARDMVEWARVYFNHQVVFEANNKFID